MAQPLVRMGKVTEVGMRTGMAFTIMSFGALAGPPISGAIFDRTGKFENVGYYAGGSFHRPPMYLGGVEADNMRYRIDRHGLCRPYDHSATAASWEALWTRLRRRAPLHDITMPKKMI